MTNHISAASLSQMLTYDGAAGAVQDFSPQAFRADVDRLNDMVSDPGLSGIDATVTNACSAFQQCSGPSTEKREFTPEQSRTLILYARRMAVAVLRGASVEGIGLGLTALALEDIQFDYRETLMSLAALWHAAIRRGVDFHAEVTIYEPLFSGQFKQLVYSLLTIKTPSILHEYGLEEIMSPHGVTIAWIPP